MFEHILILCVGNVCRSPMAAAILAAELAPLDNAPRVSSAGVAAVPGDPADEIACQLVAERGLDLSAHRARPVTPALLRSADLVLVMETEQRRFLLAQDPAAAGKTFLLGHWSGTEIADPYCQPLAAYTEALERIDAGIAHWLARIVPMRAMARR